MKLLRLIKEIVVVYLIQYFLIIGLSYLYLLKGNNDLKSYLSNTVSIITIILNIIIIIYLYKKNYRKENVIKLTKYFPLLTLGVSIAIVINMILFLFNQENNVSTIPIIIAIISSGIVGPILEEILFRYILLNRLLKENSPKKAIIISTIIFGLLHGNLIGIIYALILGLVLNIMYYKYKNILVPITIHVSANIIVIFLNNYNHYIFILSIIILLISILLIIRDGFGSGRKKNK